MNCPQCSEPAPEGTTVCGACGAVLSFSAGQASTQSPTRRNEPAPQTAGGQAGLQAGLGFAPAREENASASASPAPALDESPTAAALATVTQINQTIARAPLPPAYLHTLKRVGIGVGAFIVAAFLGIYLAKGGDWMEEKLQKSQAEQTQRDAESQMVEQQYERIAGIVPSDQLKQLLKQAGSKKELVERIQQDPRTGRFMLRNK